MKYDDDNPHRNIANNMSVNHDLSIELLKNTPPLTVAGLTLYGVSLQDWVLVMTLIYTCLSVVFLLRDKVWKPWKAKRNGRK